MFGPTVDSVLDGFNKSIDSLRAIAKRESTDAFAKRTRASALNTEADEHAAEMQRAERIADKIASLIE